MSTIPQEEVCPIAESVLADLYRASPQRLHASVESVPARVRALLAIYCFRRAHLSTLGMAIASTCERDELIKSGGQLGAVLFAQSREPPHVAAENRRKITLPGAHSTIVVPHGLV